MRTSPLSRQLLLLPAPRKAVRLATSLNVYSRGHSVYDVHASPVRRKGQGMPVPLDRPLVCPVLVGRTAHLAALDAALERAQASSCQVVLIAGEAGIGKTSLLAEERARAQHRGFRPLRSACSEPDRSLAYGPLMDLIQRLLARETDDDLTASWDSSPCYSRHQCHEYTRCRPSRRATRALLLR